MNLTVTSYFGRITAKLLLLLPEPSSDKRSGLSFQREKIVHGMFHMTVVSGLHPQALGGIDSTAVAQIYWTNCGRL